MSKYIATNNNYDVYADGNLIVHDTLPPAIYMVRYTENPAPKYYLEKTKDFNIPEGVYGNLTARTERIINTFIARTESTGVMLSGIRGSGKTFQTKHVADTLVKKYNIPAVIVSEFFNPSDLSHFIGSISCTCMVLFEEFEKFYKTINDNPSDDSLKRGRALKKLAGHQTPVDLQEGLLSLFDGVFEGKKLFMFTCNSTYAVNELLLNRPGRVFYHFKYSGVSAEIVQDYCSKMLNNQDYTKQIVTISDYLDENFTFDIMKAIVDEVNRYNVPPHEVIHELNIEPDQMQSSYDVQIECLNGMAIALEWQDRSIYIENYVDPSVEITLDVNYVSTSKAQEEEIRKIDQYERRRRGTMKYMSSNDDFEEEIAVVAETVDETGYGGTGFTAERKEKIIHIRHRFYTSDIVETARGKVIYEHNHLRVTLTRRRMNNLWKYMMSG